MGFVVREAAPTDLAGIVDLHAASFAASDHGYHGEADLVRALVEGGDAVVSLVAEQDGRAYGHVLFTRMQVEADGRSIAAVALAPLAVMPDHRRHGTGGALVHAGHAMLIDRGVKLSFVLGDPDYYGRFGYDVAVAAPFESPYAGEYFMGLWLAGDAPAIHSGVARHAAPFASTG